MEAFFSFLGSQAGMGLLTKAVEVGAGLIYPRVVDLVSKGEAWLEGVTKDDPLMTEALAYVKQFIPASMLTEPGVVSILTSSVQAEVNRLTATDNSVMGTKAS